MSKIVVITGERGAGKSRCCGTLLEQSRGQTVGGFISPAVYENGVKTAFYTLDTGTGEKRLCGKRVSGDGTIGCWELDEDVMEWGNELLRSACPCDILFIDELGPLEFEKHRGYTAAFEVLRRDDYGTAYVVVRSSCLAAFREMFTDFELISIGNTDVPLD